MSKARRKSASGTGGGTRPTAAGARKAARPAPGRRWTWWALGGGGAGRVGLVVALVALHGGGGASASTGAATPTPSPSSLAPAIPNQAGSLTAPSGQSLHLFLNGLSYRGDPRALPLTTHADITIEAGPTVPPTTYTFPAGV